MSFSQKIKSLSLDELLKIDTTGLTIEERKRLLEELVVRKQKLEFKARYGEQNLV